MSDQRKQDTLDSKIKHLMDFLAYEKSVLDRYAPEHKKLIDAVRNNTNTDLAPQLTLACTLSEIRFRHVGEEIKKLQMQIVELLPRLKTSDNKDAGPDFDALARYISPGSDNQQPPSYPVQ